MDRFYPKLTISLFLGLLISYYVDDIYTLSLIFIVFMFMLYLIGRLTLEKRLIYISLFFLLGISLGKNKLASSSLLAFKDQEVFLEGEIIGRKSMGEEENTYLLRVDKLGHQSRTYRLDEKIRIKHRGQERIDLGDRISFRGTLRENMVNTNPKFYNMKKDLLSRSIYTNIFLEDKNIEGLAYRPSTTSYIRKGFNKRVDQAFTSSSLDPRNQQLIKSIILGDYTYLEDMDQEKYRDLGLAHILAVSGLHIGIISSFFIFLLVGLTININIARFITLALIWVYAYLIGFPISILRANIMLSIYFMSQVFHHPYDSLNSLFFAGLIILLIRPFAFFSLSFKLSFMASFSLIYIDAVFKDLLPGDKTYLDQVLNLIRPVLSVQLGLYPLQAYYFNSLQLLSWLANLLIVPLISLALNIAFLSLLLTRTHLIHRGLLAFLNLLLGLNFYLVDTIARLGPNNIRLASPQLGDLVLFLILVLAGANLDRLRKFPLPINRVFLLLLAINIGFIGLAYGLDNSLEIHFIDVGQGDAILIRNKRENILLDTGGQLLSDYSIGENITRPYLVKNNVRRLDSLIISHFHDDHSRAALDLIGEIPIGQILYPYYDEEGVLCRQILNNKIKKSQVHLGKFIGLSDGSQLIFLNDRDCNQGLKSWENNSSIVTLIHKNGRKILLTGDIEREGEARLKNHPLIRDIDVLKVPHHGSKTSSSQEFLDHTRPRLAIFTVGRNNMFNHPSQEVLDRYTSLGSQLARTDEDGRILLRVDKDIRLETYLGQEIDFSYYAFLVALYGFLFYRFFHYHYRNLGNLYYNRRGR